MPRALLAAVVIAAAGSPVVGMQIAVSPRYAGYYNADYSAFFEKPASIWLGLEPRDPNIHHVFEFDMRVTGLVADQSFAFVRFDINLGAGLLRDAVVPNYEGDNASWNTGSGAGRSGVKYVNNADQGDQDLKDIYHNSTVNTGAQMNLGEAAIETLGRIYVSVKPTHSFNSLTIDVTPIAGDTWGTWDNIVTAGPPARNSTGQQVGYQSGFIGGAMELTHIEPPYGDANGDWVIDGTDFVIWSEHVGQTSVFPRRTYGDFDGDGDVDGSDFAIWSNNVGSVQAPGGLAGLGAIPEPASLGLAAAGLLTVRRRRR